VIVSSIMRFVVTVGILVAVYFLIIRPVLDTTDSVSHDINHAVNHGLNSAQKQFNQATGQNNSHKGGKKN
jgi:hypothetical protein